jgi:hypothetical protein
MSVGKHKIPDSALSRTHIDESIKALLKKVRVVRDYWIPYLAGYSMEWVDDPIVFIDQRLPKTLMDGNKVYDVTRYLIIHECVEKCLMHDLGLPYELAHNLATAAEKSAVEADGLSWAVYTKLLQPYIRQATYKPKNLESPTIIDFTPYLQEHFSGLDKMAKAA